MHDTAFEVAPHPRLDTGRTVQQERGGLGAELGLIKRDQSPAAILRRLQYETAWRRGEWGETGAECGGAVAQRIEGDVVTVVPLLCGKWSCPLCGVHRAAWFIQQVQQAMDAHGLDKFWTLTIDHKGVGPRASWDLISWAWNRFRTRVVRDHGPLAFIWVVEPQSSGHAHMHVLWDRWLDKQYVSDTWRWATQGSYIVDVERVRSVDVARYLTKYLSKLAGQSLMLPGWGELQGRHRFGKSRGISFDPFRKPAGGWELVSTGYKGYRRWLIASSEVLEDRTRGVPSIRARVRWPTTRGVQGSQCLCDPARLPKGVRQPLVCAPMVPDWERDWWEEAHNAQM